MAEYCRILIVDDEYIMRRGIRYMMNWEELGCEVIERHLTEKKHWI